MPQIFRIGPYRVYFWSNEGDPLEPIHVHITDKKPGSNATKLWITQSGKCLICNNDSQISAHELRKLIRIVEANSSLVVDKWYSYFGTVHYYC